jgi:hypothetical protein
LRPKHRYPLETAQGRQKSERTATRSATRRHQLTSAVLGVLFFPLGRIDDHRLDGPGCDLMAVGVDVRTHELVRSGIE